MTCDYSPLMFAPPVLKSILPMPWRCSPRRPGRPRPPGRRGGLRERRAALDLARRLGRNDALDELAGAYAEACELPAGSRTPFRLQRQPSTTDSRARARRLTRGAVVAWDLGRFADANQLLDAADRALAGVAACAENVEVEEVRVRFAARSNDLAGLDQSIARLAALGERPAPAGPARRWCTPRFKGHPHRSLPRRATRRRRAHGTRPQRGAVLVGEACCAPCRLSTVLGRPDRRPGQRRGGDPPGQAKRSTRARDPPRRTARVVEVVAGDWQAALRRTFDDLGLAQRVGLARGQASRSHLRAWFRRGRLDEAADRVSEARRLFGRWSAADRHVFAYVDLVEGMIALARHEVDRRSRLRRQRRP